MMLFKMLLGVIFLLTLAPHTEARKVQVQLILMTASVANMALLGGNVDFISTAGSAIGAILRGAP